MNEIEAGYLRLMKVGNVHLVVDTDLSMINIPVSFMRLHRSWTRCLREEVVDAGLAEMSPRKRTGMHRKIA